MTLDDAGGRHNSWVEWRRESHTAAMLEPAAMNPSLKCQLFWESREITGVRAELDTWFAAFHSPRSATTACGRPCMLLKFRDAATTGATADRVSNTLKPSSPSDIPRFEAWGHRQQPPLHSYLMLTPDFCSQNAVPTALLRVGL